MADAMEENSTVTGQKGCLFLTINHQNKLLKVGMFVALSVLLQI